MRRKFLILSISLCVTVACFWPLFLDPLGLLMGMSETDLNDLGAWFLPHRMIPGRVWSWFQQLPFWAPWWGGGAPYLGNPQAALFYPLNWFFWFLDPHVALSWFLVLHHFIAVLGSYRLARLLGCQAPGGVFAGLSFGLSPVLLAHTGAGHYASLGAVAWYPWAFSCYLALLRGQKGSGPALAFFLALSILAGHLQEAFYLALTLAVVCLVDVLTRLSTGSTRQGCGIAIQFLAACLGCLGLIAVELIPMLIYLGQGATSARLGLANEGTPGLANLLQLLHPAVLGAAYTGPGVYYWETLCHFGVGTLCLALLGFVITLRLPGKHRWLAVIAILSILLAFGKRVPVFVLVTEYLPGLAQFRCSGRWFFITALCLACLAGKGLDAVMDVRRTYRLWGTPVGRVLKVATLAVLVIGLAVALVCQGTTVETIENGEPVRVQFDRLRMLAGGTCFLGLMCVILRAQPSPGFGWMLLLVGIVESAVFSRTVLQVHSQEILHRQSSVTDFLSRQPAGWRIFGPQDLLSDYQTLDHSLLKVNEYQPVPLARPLQYVKEMVRTEAPLNALVAFEPVDLSRSRSTLIDGWSIRYLLFRGGQASLPEGVNWTKVAEFTSPSQTEIWENPNALPRGYVVGQVRALGPEAGPDEISDALARLDPRQEVILERDLLPEGPRQEFTVARRLEDTPNRVVLEVETIKPGYLVLTDSWYPGWSAQVDGRETAVLVANHAFRAVALPEPGLHSITFSYFPTGLAAGLCISSLTVGLLLCWLAYDLPGRRQRFWSIKI